MEFPNVGKYTSEHGAEGDVDHDRDVLKKARVILKVQMTRGMHDMGDNKKIEVVKKTEAMSRKVTGAQSESHSCRPRKFI